MGGQYEETLEKPSKSKAKGGSGTVGKIRFHESAGEVHFHDDDAKLKVALPVHVWADAWARIGAGHPEFWYFDPHNETTLEVKLTAVGGAVDIELSIDKAKVGKAFEKLQKFTEAV